MEPTTPEIPTPEIPKAEGPEPVERDNHWITIASMAVFVILSLAAVAFLYYQNQKLKTMLASYQSTPTPLATADPTANWKIYTKDNYQIKYPNNWTISPITFGFSVNRGAYKINIQTSNPGFGPGICIFSDSPNFNNPYSDNPILAGSKCPGIFVETKGIQYVFRRKTTPNASPEGVSNGKWSIYVKDSQGNFATNPPIEYVGPVSYDQSTITLMDQILSTFKFLGQSETQKTYINDKFGFQFAYPSTGYDLKIWEPTGSLLFSLSLLQQIQRSTPQSPEIGVSVYSNPNNQPLKDWVNTYSLGGEIFFPSLTNLKDYQMAGKAGLSFETEVMGIKSPYVVIPLDNKSIIGIHYTKMGPNTSSLETIFNQVLSTFKFTQ